MSISKTTQEYRLNKWIQIIQECHASGQSIASWCRENNINAKSYYYWLRKIRAAACSALVSTNPDNKIVPLEIQNLTSSSSNITPVSSETVSGDITIHLGSVVLEIHNSASVNLIENVIRVLQNAR